MFKNLVQSFFYGNIFYGICTVALCIETNVSAQLPLNNLSFYCSIATATIAFYTLIYYSSNKNINQRIVEFDWADRSLWYSHHRKFVRWILLCAIIILVVSTVVFTYNYALPIFKLSWVDWLLVILFPFLAVAYSYNVLPLQQFAALRKVGIVKPFILAFIWAGFVTIYPVIAIKLESIQQISSQSLLYGWLFLQNFIFISILCLLFDIKDVQQDQQQHLRTIPVILGSTRTLYFIIIPLIIISLLVEWYYCQAILQLQNALVLRSIPSILLLLISLQVRKKKTTLYYLAVIDGMLLLKAIAGILSSYL